tara:strand:+ start:15982 stop:16512 length:531 start_codon:yes stop_codon:yes gene_type:complete
MNSALFLDRDGVINIDYGHVYKKENFDFIDNIFDIVSFAKDLGYLVIIITNQAGIAKGLYTEKDFQRLMLWVAHQFEINNGKIDKTYFCPFHKNGVVKKYTKDSIDRKPQPGMILKACKEFNINPKTSVLIGDKASDIKAANSSLIGKSVYFGQDKCSTAYKSISSLLDVKKELNF